MAEPFDTRLVAALDLAGEMARFAAGASPDEGAQASFAGLCRAATGAGEPLLALVLETYRSMTLASMQEIMAAARGRFAVSRGVIVHAHGRIAPGAPIVWVGFAASHRRAALDAVDYAMDRLKSDAIFWKREETASGAAWIEPTAQDYDHKARW